MKNDNKKRSYKSAEEIIVSFIIFAVIFPFYCFLIYFFFGGLIW